MKVREQQSQSAEENLPYPAVESNPIHQPYQGLNADLKHQVNQGTTPLQQAHEQQEILFDVAIKMREALDLETIFRTTTQEIRQLLKVERVVVYRFNDDWSGEFISDFEATNPTQPPLTQLDKHAIWNDTYLQETQGGRCRSYETIAVNDTHQAGFSPCYAENLERFQIRAYVIAPIFLGPKLWGLLAAYQHREPYHWQVSEIKFMSQIATQLGVAVQQADLLQQTHQQTEQLIQAQQDLHNMQAHLIHIEKMSSLGQLLAGVAHEINNPVNFIYGNLTYISQYTEDLLDLVGLCQEHISTQHPQVRDRMENADLEFVSEDLPKMLGSMKLGSERIRQIVLSLRNFSRVDQADMDVADIHAGIESTLLILQHRLKVKSDSPAIAVVREYGQIPSVECYAGQLNQVFMNILCNAIDALEERDAPNPTGEAVTGKITIRTAVEEPNWVTIRFIDNGPGIPEEIHQKLFSPFFTTKPVGKGTGMGMSISHQIITEKHKGSLQCVSKSGQGAEFIIKIPIQQL